MGVAFCYPLRKICRIGGKIMAIFKKVAKAGKYLDDYAIHNLITYITRPDKTPSQMIGGYGVDPDHIADSMAQISNQFSKNSRIRLHHFIVSFTRWECSAPGVLYCIGMAISNQIGPEYQIAFALHEDTEYPHLHFVFNAISHIDGHRYRGGKKEYHELYHLVRQALKGFRIRELLPVDYREEDGEE